MMYQLSVQHNMVYAISQGYFAHDLKEALEHVKAKAMADFEKTLDNAIAEQFPSVTNHNSSAIGYEQGPEDSGYTGKQTIDVLVDAFGVEVYQYVKSPQHDCGLSNCKFLTKIDDGEIVESTIKDIVVHLNDYAKWTREEIADWLDTLDVDLSLKE